MFRVFLRLGLTSFGGPVAHLGYFRDEFVERRHWLDEQTYADLVALWQFLPGPAAAKVGIAVGLLRAGYAGALAAWAGFTLPSALAMVLFAYGVGPRRRARHGMAARAESRGGRGGGAGGARHGAHARARPRRATLAVVAAVVVLAVPSAWGQIGAIVLGCLVGVTVLHITHSDHMSLPLR